MQSSKSAPPKALTSGAIKQVQDTTAPENLRKLDFVLQVTKVDEVAQNPEKKESTKIKQKLVLSDGVCSMKTLVSESVFNKQTTPVKQFDVVRVTSLRKCEIPNKEGLWVAMLAAPTEILVSSLTKSLGSPQDIMTIDAELAGQKKVITIPGVADEVVAPVDHASNKSSVGPTTSSANSRIPQQQPAPQRQQIAPGNVEYMPLKALNTFARDWKVQARVASKSEKRTTNKGGSLLKIALVDMYGTQIEGTFFNEAADNFDPLIQENKVYLFSNGVVKMANKRFTSIKNDFCIVFEKNARIIEVADDGSIDAQAFEFCDIESIQEVQQMKTVDLCAIIAEVSENETVNLRKGTQKQRKYVTLVDDSGYAISLTLWDGMNERITQDDLHKVIAVKGARVSEFGGKSLNAADDHSSLHLELKHSRCAKLQKWFADQQQKGLSDLSNFKQLTVKQGRGGDAQNEEALMSKMAGGKEDKAKSSNLNLISEINEALSHENDTDQYHFYFLNGYVSRIKNDERIYYNACMSENCRRKVIPDHDGYRCESCNKQFMTYRPTYMITAKISDFTDSIFVNFAREHGAALMGMTAEEFRDFKESESEEKVQAYFDSLLFKPFNIMVKGKFEYFNGESRMRFFAMKVFPHNVQQENKALLRRLEIYNCLDSIQESAVGHQQMFADDGFNTFGGGF